MWRKLLQYNRIILLILLSVGMFGLTLKVSTPQAVLAAFIPADIQGNYDNHTYNCSIEINPSPLTITGVTTVNFKDIKQDGIVALGANDLTTDNTLLFLKVDGTGHVGDKMAAYNASGTAGSGSTSFKLSQLSVGWIEQISNRYYSQQKPTVTIELKKLFASDNQFHTLCGVSGQLVGLDTSAVEGSTYNSAACCRFDNDCKIFYGNNSYCGLDDASIYPDGSKSDSCQSGLKCTNPKYAANPDLGRKSLNAECDPENDRCVEGFCFYEASSDKYKCLAPCTDSTCIQNRYGPASNISSSAKTECDPSLGCNCTPGNVVGFTEPVFTHQLDLNIPTYSQSASCNSKCVEEDAFVASPGQQKTYYLLNGGDVTDALEAKAFICYKPTDSKQCVTNGCTINATYDSATATATVSINATCLSQPATYTLNYSGVAGQLDGADFTLPDNLSDGTVTKTLTKVSLTGKPTFQVLPKNGGSDAGSNTCKAEFSGWVPSSSSSAAPGEGNPTSSISSSVPDGGDLGSDAFGRGNCPYIDPKSAKIDLKTGETVCLDGTKGCTFKFLPICGATPTADCITKAQFTEGVQCSVCVRNNNTWVGGIGCINTSPQGIFVSLIRIALGVIGGIALLRMIYLGYVYQTGDEGKIKEARSGVVSTLAGLVLALFSVLVLRIIGVNVLDVVPAGFFGG